MTPRAPGCLLAFVVAVASLLWISALSMPDGKLRISFIGVGQGDATLITMPSGRQILVHGSPDPVRIAQFLGRKMPFRDRTVGLVVLTHPHVETLKALRRHVAQGLLFLTSERGTVEFTTDGKRLGVKTER